jgi:hypothetical protein
MGQAVHYRRQAIDCARKATETTDQEECNLLFEMSEAWTKIASVEADVKRQAAAVWTIHTLHQ